jgi:FAD/FMN-containing dehydrogenase
MEGSIADPHSSAGVATTVGQCLEQIGRIVGDKGVLTEEPDVAPYLVDWRGLFHGRALAVVRPRTTDEVAAVVAVCRDFAVPVVPQGGNTGLVGGATPDGDGRAVLLQLGRMNRILDIDPANYAIAVEAGCVLEDVQLAAAGADRLFPLSFGAEGTCQIGGTIATNAGGMRALRYGTMRDLVLGLQVVLADGSVWDGLGRIRKNNTGYELRHLFIGSEGTLGIVTAAVLKLYPLPKQRSTALVALRDAGAAIELLARAREASGDLVDAFELIAKKGVDLALDHVAGARDPLSEACAYYLLVELATPAAGDALGAVMEGMLGEAFEEGLVVNAVVAASAAQAQEIWHLREAIVEGQRLRGPHLKHDICVPLSAIPSFLQVATDAVEGVDPALDVVAFGHVGDGNIHFNVHWPPATDAARRVELTHAVAEAVYDVTTALGGSISAEHGVGQLKLGDVARYRPAVEGRIMAGIRQALDPDRIMNPGKLAWWER